MRVLGVTVAMLAASALLAGCGKSGDTTPSSADAPAATPAPAPTSAEAKAIVATLPAPYNTADLTNGETKFAVCRACHTLNAGGQDMTGPNLHGIFGHKSGTKSDYKYSEPLKTAAITWGPATLDTWIANPRADVPGTKMSYIGMKNPKDRVDLIAYLAVATAEPKK